MREERPIIALDFPVISRMSRSFWSIFQKTKSSLSKSVWNFSMPVGPEICGVILKGLGTQHFP